MEAYLRVNTGNLCFPIFDFLLLIPPPKKKFLFALSYHKKGQKKCLTDLVFPITEMIDLNKL